MGTFTRAVKGLAMACCIALVMPVGDASAFCGFYVAKADTKLFNQASKVVLVRDDNRTVITMANDFQGEPEEFAIVIPVPTVIEEGQIHVTENGLLDHLDAYTSPRLVEYFDSDPCIRRDYMMKSMVMEDSVMRAMPAPKASAESLGVTIEAEYTVGEYDIVILSAEQSDGLETWLTQNGYNIPDGASEVLGSYIKQNTKFFVAKVNLEEQAKLGFTYLRPIQVAFESPKFMLPIRLGTVNANGPQELFVFTLTRKGRVETTNYRTVKLPSGMDVPIYVKDEFGGFYTSMFDTQVKKEDMRAVFLEYAWDMNWCDPCAADPLSKDELRELGVFWVDPPKTPEVPADTVTQRIMPVPPVQPRAQDVFVTRLHVRYDGEHFPEDLRFQETTDRENFQGRYVLRHPWQGESKCEQAQQYFQSLPERFEKEATTLANLTGWNIQDIRDDMEENGQSFHPVPVKDPTGPKKGKAKWWEGLW